MNRRAEQRAEQDRNEGDQGDEGVLEQFVVECAKKLGEKEGSEAAVF